jgi:DNA-binding NtrC family response regulator
LPDRVLVVDDEPDICMTLREALSETLHCEVDTAASAPEAQRLFEKGQYRLVLTDERMPGMRGTEFLKWVRERDPGVACVLMSAYPEAFARPAASRAVADSFLAKPFDLRAAVTLLDDTMQRAQSRGR